MDDRCPCGNWRPVKQKWCGTRCKAMKSHCHFVWRRKYPEQWARLKHLSRQRHKATGLANKKRWRKRSVAYREQTRRYRKKNAGRLTSKRREQKARNQKKKRSFYQWLAFMWKVGRVSQQLEVAMTERETDLEKAMAAIKSLTSEQLKDILARALRLFKESLLEAAVALMELRARGEKPELDPYLMRLLERIGSGKLLVDCVVRFAGRPHVLSAIQGKSVEEQEELLGKEDREVDERFNRRSRTGKDYADPAPKGPINLRQIAEAADHRDVAEMCMELVLASKKPNKVADILLAKLEPLRSSQYAEAGH